MVKCFPPVSTENPKKGFRAPKNIEIEYCKPFLHLDLVPFPHAILMPLGNIALKGLGGYDTSITKALGIRKQIHIDSKYYTVIPNFHPSYILRNPEKEKTFIEVLHIAIRAYSWC